MKKLLSLLFFICLFSNIATSQVTFWADTVYADPGKKVYVPIRVADFVEITGFQFSVQWDPSVLQYDTATNFGLPNFDASSISADADTIASGKIGVLWFGSGSMGATVADGTSVLELVFNVIGTIGDSSLIEFTESPVPFEVLDKAQNNIGLEPISGVVRVMKEPVGTTDLYSNCNGFSLYNPDPNPFQATSTIKWESPVNNKVNVFITDMAGKRVYNVNNYINIKGRNQITLSSNDLPGPGTYIFGIQSEGNLVTRKIILMK